MSRLLANAGVRVVLADHLRWPLASASRLHDGYHRVPSFVFDHAGARAAMQDVLAVEKIDLVIPTCEETLHLAYFWRQNEPKTRLFAPDFETLVRVHNKHTFMALCAEVGMTVPDTWLLNGPGDVAATRKDAGNLVYKPVWSRFGASVLITPKPEALSRLKPTKTSPWIAQQFVAGHEVSVYAVAKRGRIAALSAYRALVRARGGAAVAFAPVEADLVRPVVAAIVQHLNWTGQISFDLIVQPDGQVLPIECNPRATSGLHFFRDPGAFAAALFDEASHVVPDVIAPQGVPLAVKLYSMRYHPFEAFQRVRPEIESVFDWPGDRVGLWPQVKSLFEFAATAASKQVSLQHASTIDIEWNG